MGQITGPNLIVVFNLHYWGESSGQSLAEFLFPIPGNERQPQGGQVQYLVTWSALSSAVSILG